MYHFLSLLPSVTNSNHYISIRRKKWANISSLSHWGSESWSENAVYPQYKVRCFIVTRCCSLTRTRKWRVSGSPNLASPRSAMPEALICERHEEWTLSRFHRYSDIPLSQFFGPADFMPTINLSKFSDMTTNLSAQPYDTSATAEQPWVNSKCQCFFHSDDITLRVNCKEVSLHDSDIEVRSGDGFIFQLHRVALGVSTGAFPGSEIDTGGEMVQLTEPANVLGILFAFLYPKTHPDLHGESFEMLAAIAEAAGKYEVISAVDICNERLLCVFLDSSSPLMVHTKFAYNRKFLPKHAPEILVHAVKHHYPRLISAILPHLARAPFIPVLEKLPPSYMVPWVCLCFQK